MQSLKNMQSLSDIKMNEYCVKRPSIPSALDDLYTTISSVKKALTVLDTRTECLRTVPAITSEAAVYPATENSGFVLNRIRELNIEVTHIAEEINRILTEFDV